MSKKKIVLISDHPLVPSGVGTQAKYLIEGLLATGKYQFVCLGGAIQHPSYNPQKVAPEKYGDDWIIYPVKGFGDKNFLRQVLMHERPDAIMLFTDPRFFTWVWEMEDEIRQVCPILYWHVWDNDPTPRFNKAFYDSTDFIGALSLKTYGLLQDLQYPVEKYKYIPHSLPSELFKPLPDAEVSEFKAKHFGPHKDKEFIVFWNNRNARRKMTGDVVSSFAKFANGVDKSRVALMMHTNVKDPEGQDVLAVAREFDIENNLIISENRIPPEELNWFYNVADVTINIASNEGFGLGTLESLFAGTPIIAHFTGGLQFQIGDWWEGRRKFSWQSDMTATAEKMWRARKGNWWGVPVFPASRSCTGSQDIPYIYDDRVSHDDVIKALTMMYDLGRPKRKHLGLEARKWATKNFDQREMISSWDGALEETINRHKVNSQKQTVRTVQL